MTDSNIQISNVKGVNRAFPYAGTDYVSSIMEEHSPGTFNEAHFVYGHYKEGGISFIVRVLIFSLC